MRMRLLAFRILTAATVLGVILLGGMAAPRAAQAADPVTIEVVETIHVTDSPQVLPPAVIEVVETIHVADSPQVVPPAVINVVESISVTDSPQVLPVVTFPDANLLAVIRAAIGKPSGDIYPADLLPLDTLDGHGRGIINLSGLEHCVNLITLQLDNNQISNLSPLQNLTKLTNLFLNGNQISNLSPLQGLTSLQNLSIEGNQISDISPLQNLTSLISLNISINQISIISPLQGLTSLKTLWLINNQIIDLSPLQNLTYLGVLLLDSNKISDISPLQNLANLTILQLIDNQISDISPLQNLTHLTYLFLNNNRISDVSPLQNLTSLTRLVLLGNQISNIQPLVDNAGLVGSGDSVVLNNNPLSLYSITNNIPLLRARGVDVTYTSPDSDGDGIWTVVDVQPGIPSAAFSDHTTSGSVVSLDPGVTIGITDAPQAADGIEVVVSGPGSGSANIMINIAGGSTLRLPPGDYILTSSAADNGLRVDVRQMAADRTVTLRRPDSKAVYSMLQVGAYKTKSGSSVILEVSDGGLAKVEYTIGGTTTVIIIDSGEKVSLAETIAGGNLQNVTVSALQGNVTVNGIVVPQGQSLTISNNPPVLGPITAPVNPIQVNTAISANATFTDPDLGDTHTAVWEWGDGSTSPGTVVEASGSVTGGHAYTTAGVYALKLTLKDVAGASVQSFFYYVVVYDPAAGFVTGGGWINSPTGAYTPNPSLTGKANFGFVSKYQKGATTPTGTTEFQFKVANLNFHSESYQWLVIAGPKAQYKGVGTINGSGEYGFMLTAIDGQINGGGGTDKFRIKIWDKKANDQVIYDNKLGEADDSNAAIELGGGSIVIHS